MFHVAGTTLTGFWWDLSSVFTVFDAFDGLFFNRVEHPHWWTLQIAAANRTQLEQDRLIQSLDARLGEELSRTQQVRWLGRGRFLCRRTTKCDRPLRGHARSAGLHLAFTDRGRWCRPRLVETGPEPWNHRVVTLPLCLGDNGLTFRCYFFSNSMLSNSSFSFRFSERNWPWRRMLFSNPWPARLFVCFVYFFLFILLLFVFLHPSVFCLSLQTQNIESNRL